MKPAVVVKTKKGKRYLQVKTADGELIHIGPASILENWQLAFTALKYEYESLVFYEMYYVYPFVTAENLNTVEATGTSLGQQSEKWQDYLRKVNKKHNERERERREYEKASDCKIAPDPWYEKWENMLHSNAAKKDPALLKEIKYHLRHYIERLSR